MSVCFTYADSKTLQLSDLISFSHQECMCYVIILGPTFRDYETSSILVQSAI